MVNTILQSMPDSSPDFLVLERTGKVCSSPQSPLYLPVSHTQTHMHSRQATKGAIKWARCTVLKMRALLFLS